MRARTFSRLFEVTTASEKTLEDGSQKMVKETFVIDAMTFTEAEERATKEVGVYASGEFEVIGEGIAPYKEIFFSEDNKADKYYKVKIAFITIDEVTAKEKQTKCLYLVQSDNTDNAVKATHEVMSKGMSDYLILSVAETKILDVYAKD